MCKDLSLHIRSSSDKDGDLSLEEGWEGGDEDEEEEQNVEENSPPQGTLNWAQGEG